MVSVSRSRMQFWRDGVVGRGGAWWGGGVGAGAGWGTGGGVTFACGFAARGRKRIGERRSLRRAVKVCSLVLGGDCRRR